MSVADRAPRCPFVAIAAVVVAMACGGCSSPGEVHHAAPEATTRTHQPGKQAVMSKAEEDLQRGIRSYEEAEYEMAARSFQSALDRGLRTREDKASAYKYLAFVDCTSGRMKSCRSRFRNALQADPTFELAPAEAGHPIWGPVFRSAKLEVNGKSRTRQARLAPTVAER